MKIETLHIALLAMASLLTACQGPSASNERQGANTTHEGRLEQGDAVLEQDGTFYDSYAFAAKEGDRITLEMNSSEFDPYLVLYDSESNQLAKNDDIQLPNKNSRIVFTAPRDDTYTVVANCFERGMSGAYTLSIRAEPAATE